MQAKNGRQAISDMHKYFDYNMRQKLTKLNRDTGIFEFISWNTQVYQPALYKAGICFRLGQYDQALISVRESIKLSQSKNDSSFILHCLVWLKQIMGVLGNKSQELKILHHILAQTTKKKKPAQHDDLISIMALLNFVNHESALKIGSTPKPIEKALLKLEIVVQGPLWYPVLQAAQNQIIKLNENITARDLLKEMMPLVLLRKSQLFFRQGQTLMAECFY